MLIQFVIVGWEAIFLPRTSPKSNQTSLPTVFGNAEKIQETGSREDRYSLTSYFVTKKINRLMLKINPIFPLFKQ